MTIRAVLLGLLGVVIVVSVTYVNDSIIKQTPFVGNHLPLSLFGGLIIFLLLINPILARFGPSAPLRGKELAVIIALTLSACVVPGSGLMRTLPTTLMLPHHHVKTESGWQRQGLVELEAANRLLADPGEDGRALDDYIQGMQLGNEVLPIQDLPWANWTGALGFWVPVIAVVFLSMLGLAVVLHRQWSHHEQLPYPIAQFANSLLPEKPGQARGLVFKQPLFWYATVGVVAVHLNNFAFVWFPDLVQIPTTFDFSSLLNPLPEVKAAGSGAYLFRIYFSMVAIAYFLAADVGLAIGIAPLLYPFIGAFFAAQGVSLKGGGYMAPERMVVAGAFIGMFLSLLYTGRHYYFNTFKKAIGLRSQQEIEATSVWGTRVFLLGMTVFVGALMWAGLDWVLALLMAGLIVVYQAVLGRLVAETGIFFIQTWWLPAAVFVALFGAQALSPEAVLILFLVSIVFLIDPREALMPFLMNALKVVELRSLKVGKPVLGMGAAILLGLGVGVPVTLYFQYSNGVNMSDTWVTNGVAKSAFNETLKVSQRLEAQGLLEGAEVISGLERFGHMVPDTTATISFFVGLSLVILFTMGRLRFAKWPLHPVCFIVFCTYAGYMSAFSFLLGWMIKVLTTKYGGERGYHALKPLMFGLIAGELLGGFFPIFIGWIYFLVTGDPPKPFNILPG
ncbi:MAG: DUF6785 family protein [Verrucomicrobiales bacterium]